MAEGTYVNSSIDVDRAENGSSTVWVGHGFSQLYVLCRICRSYSPRNGWNGHPMWPLLQNKNFQKIFQIATDRRQMFPDTPNGAPAISQELQTWEGSFSAVSTPILQASDKFNLRQFFDNYKIWKKTFLRQAKLRNFSKISSKSLHFSEYWNQYSRERSIRIIGSLTDFFFENVSEFHENATRFELIF